MRPAQCAGCWWAESGKCFNEKKFGPVPIGPVQIMGVTMQSGRQGHDTTPELLAACRANGGGYTNKREFWGRVMGSIGFEKAEEHAWGTSYNLKEDLENKS